MKWLLLSLLLCVPVSAFALEPFKDPVPVWSGTDAGNGKTFYSNGLDTVTVTPQGGTQSSYNAWSRDGQNTVGTIYSPARSAPSPSPLGGPYGNPFYTDLGAAAGLSSSQPGR